MVRLPSSNQRVAADRAVVDIPFDEKHVLDHGRSRSPGGWGAADLALPDQLELPGPDHRRPKLARLADPVVLSPAPLRCHAALASSKQGSDVPPSRMRWYVGWVVAQCLIQFCTFAYYYWSPAYKTARLEISIGVTVARAGASGVVVNMCLAYLLACRNLLSLLRTTWIARYLVLDKSMHAHKVVGYTIAWHTLVHVGAHCYNFQYYANYHRDTLHGTPGYVLMVTTPTGATGCVLLLTLIVMLVTSLPCVRRKHFNFFYYTHHLHFVLVGAMLAHGGFCFLKSDFNPVCGIQAYWKMYAVPVFVYIIERLLRELRSRRATRICRVVLHPSKVVELRIRKRTARPLVGQYIYINCPELGKLEWHPFTLTSAPEDPYLAVHIRVVGDWTRKLAERLGCDVDAYNNPKDPSLHHNPLSPALEKGRWSYASPHIARALPTLMIDGPYGAPTDQVFQYEVVVMVGAGIGVTPFASVLKSLWRNINDPVVRLKLRKLHFFWICREIQAFEWFQDLLFAIEEQDSMSELLETRAYLTGKLSIDQIANITLTDGEHQRDAITGRRTPTYFGRPNFDVSLYEIGLRHPNTNIGVFFCGPKPLGRTLRKACAAQAIPGRNTKFTFHSEHF